MPVYHRAVVPRCRPGARPSRTVRSAPSRGPGDEDLFRGVIGFVQVEVRVGHGQCGFAEQLAGWVGAVGDDAAAQVDEVAAQGQVAVHVDVGAVHGQRGPVLGHVRRWATAQQTLGADAGGEVGTAAHRGGAPGGRVGGSAEPALQGVVRAAGRGCGWPGRHRPGRTAAGGWSGPGPAP